MEMQMTTIDFEMTRPDRAYRVRQVAVIFDTSERQVWRMIESGELRAERLSARCVRVFDSEIARYRASRRDRTEAAQ
jgi:predicted DNA-binding transcriptional regulator AlpA